MTRLVAVVALVLAAPAAALAAPTAPVAGSVFGPVTSVKGSTFTLTSSLVPKGKSTVSVSSATVITEQATAARSSLEVGACVVASGSRNSKGVVAAARITLSDPVKGQCSTGFGGRRTGGQPPANRTGTTPRRPPGGFTRGTFGFAFGKVTAVKGSTLTVSGTRGSSKVTTAVTVSAKTQLEKTVRVEPSAITTGSCAFVNGTSGDKGVTVEAERIALTKKTNGSCTTGFRRPPGNG